MHGCRVEFIRPEKQVLEVVARRYTDGAFLLDVGLGVGTAGCGKVILVRTGLEHNFI